MKMQINYPYIPHCDQSLNILNTENGLVQERELANTLRKYALRDALIGLARLSSFIFTDQSKHKIGRTGFIDPKTGLFITQHCLAYLANILIISGSNDFKRAKLFNRDNPLILFNIYNNLLVQPETVPGYVMKNQDDLTASFLRMYYEQIGLQYEPVHLIGRSILLYIEMVKINISTKYGNLDDIFFNETGLTIEETFAIGIAVLAISLKTGVFGILQLTDTKIPTLKLLLVEDKMEKFINLFSVNYAKFREEDGKMNEKLIPINTKYRFNPLCRYPIVQSAIKDDCQFIVPNINIFVERVFGGVYWWYFTYFRERKDIMHFTDYFGGVFQNYVGKILRYRYGDNLKREFKYADDRRFIDWWLEEDGIIHLFEVKSHQLPPTVISSGDIIALKKHLKDVVVKAIVQVFKRVKDIHNFKELSVFKDKECLPVIIFNDIPFLETNAYFSWIKEMLSEEALKSGYEDLVDFNFFLLNVGDIEDFCSTKGISLREVLLKLRANKNSNFRESLRERASGQIIVNPLLKNIFDEFTTKYAGSPPISPIG